MVAAEGAVMMSWSLTWCCGVWCHRLALPVLEFGIVVI
jgi:hypothetical protein